jgi:Kef-type K+ transport system membrane component KefB
VRSDRNALARISFGFFIPVYFALIGVQLDLIHHFNPVFFLGFLVYACIAKAASVYLGARLSREDKFTSWSLAVAMNARGGPGIVLASIAYATGIINQAFFVSLVMLSVITSLLAGSWLERIAFKLGAPSRQHEQASEQLPGELGTTLQLA